MKTLYLKTSLILCLFFFTVSGAFSQTLDNKPLSICNVPPGCQEVPICTFTDDCFRFDFYTPKDLGNGTSVIKIMITNFSESTFRQATFELPGQGASTPAAISPKNIFRNRYNHTVANKFNDSLIAFNAINAGTFSYGGFEVYYYVVNNADLNAPYGRKIDVTAHAGRPWQPQRTGHVVINIDDCAGVPPCTKPTANITGPDSLCLFNDDPYTFTTNAVPGATYFWSATNGTITGGQGTNSIMLVPDFDLGPGMVSVIVANDCGSVKDSLAFEVIDCGPINPLPVELITFTGKASTAGVSLNWVTASEKNNDHFAVERSLDGRNFEKIGQVKGNGTTSNRSEYKYLDAKPTGELLYYRLKQVDLDGKTTSSKVIRVKPYSVPTDVLAVMMAPNPCPDQNCSILLRGTDPNLPVTVIMKDLTGRTIFSKVIPGDQTSFSLPKGTSGAGIYILSVRNGNNTAYQKIILQQ